MWFGIIMSCILMSFVLAGMGFISYIEKDKQAKLILSRLGHIGAIVFCCLFIWMDCAEFYRKNIEIQCTVAIINNVACVSYFGELAETDLTMKEIEHWKSEDGDYILKINKSTGRNYSEGDIVTLSKPEIYSCGIIYDIPPRVITK